MSTLHRAFIFKKRSKTKSKASGSGGKKKYRWGKKKGGSKFASTVLPVIEEEDQEREKDADNDGIVDGTVATEERVSRRTALSLIDRD